MAKSKLTIEERQEKHREDARKWAQEHAEENRERARQWRLENPEKASSDAKRAYAREYSSQWRKDPKNKEKLAAQQSRRYKKSRNGRRRPGGLCELCGNEETALARQETGEIRALQQDHCHATGVLRGLLCLDCNRLLGAAKDNPELLRAAADYIEKYQPAQTATDLGQAFNKLLLRGNHLGA